MQRNKSYDVEHVASLCEPLPVDADCSCMSEPDLQRVDSRDGGLDASCSVACTAESGLQHLPDNVVRIIALHVLQSGARSNSVLPLLAMCGVCKHWRAAASYLEPGSHPVFDGRKSISATGTSLEQKFRRLSQQERCALLHAAAKLFRGYRSATFMGDAVDDRLLCAVASNVSLEHASVSAAPAVTDMGLAALVMHSPGLQTLAVATTSPHETYGHFLGKALELAHLEKLELKTAMLDLQGQGALARPLHTDSWPDCPSLSHLVVNNPIMRLDQLVPKLPNLSVLELDGMTFVHGTTTVPASLAVVQASSRHLVELHLQVDSPAVMDACLASLRRMRQLQTVNIAVASFVLDERQMGMLGDLPLEDLRLVSQVFKKQPTLPRPCCSHLDNQGVKAFVDHVCRRALTEDGAKPLKLSICGASQLTHDAVSALLRLPRLIKLNISGCNRIAAMDKMRLIAKIKAGREQQSGVGAHRAFHTSFN